MNGKYLVDMNIIIALFADDVTVKTNLAQAAQVFVPNIAIGELCFGALKSERASENLKRIDEFVAKNVMLASDTDTAYQYGKIKNALRIKGRPIPENDIWIAAIALEHELTLFTRDTHLSQIDGLQVMAW